MTYRKLLFCIVLFAATNLGQEPLKTILVDEFDPRIGCETMEMKLDLLFSETSKDVRAKAFVVIHQGKNVFDNAVVHKKAVNYARFRHFPADHYTVILTTGSEDIKVELWVGKNGKEPHVVSSALAVKLPENVSGTQFAEDTLELVQIDDREAYIGTGNPSCLYSFNSYIIRDLLNVNSEFEAEFRIKTKSLTRYKKLVENLKAEFQEAGIPVERLKFIYGGRDKELEGGGSKLASVTTTFVRISRK
jgi:hypothetical protein